MTKLLPVIGQELHLVSSAADTEEVLAAVLAGRVDALVDDAGVHLLPLAERTYRAFFEAMEQSAATLTVDGAILHGNPKFSALVGQPLETLRGRPFAALIQPADQERFRALLREDVNAAVEVDLVTAAGPLPVRLALSSASAGALSVICLVVTDLADHRRTQASLRRQEEKYRAAIATCGDGFFILDARGRVTEVNDAYLRLSGYPREELLGLPLRTLDDGLSPAELAACARTVTTAGHHQLETWHRTRDGRRWPAEVTVSFWPQGQRFFVFVRDISARRQAEERIRALAERMRLATRAAGIGIWDLDPRSGRLLWTEEMYVLHGVAEGAFEPHVDHWRRLLHPDDGPRIDGELQLALETADSFDAEFRIIRPDGGIRVMRSLAEIHRDDAGRAIRLLGVNWDHTDHRTMMETLRRAKEAADAANVAKSRFLATMSHELRTPLNAIIGFGQMLAANEANDERRDQLGVICQAGADLQKLIQEILDLSRIEAGKIEIELRPFHPRDLLLRLRRLLLPQVEQKGLTLTVHVAETLPERLIGDPDLLRQVLVNLVGNAIKFTHRGGISVTVERMEPADGGERVEVLFQVTDSGIGIRPENQGRIFGLFEQEDNSLTRPYGGSGLGLAISRRMVSLMGGEIWLESALGVGSRFSFTARFDTVVPELRAPGEPPSPRPAPGASQRLLVVDDDLFSRQLLSQLLQARGFEVLCADGGPRALELLSREAFDLILMDIQLPEISGLDLTRLIRSGRIAACPRQIPVIGVTAYAMRGDRERFLAHGLSDYISKPVDADLLLEAIAHQLTVRHQAPAA